MFVVASTSIGIAQHRAWCARTHMQDRTSTSCAAQRLEGQDQPRFLWIFIAFGSRLSGFHYVPLCWFRSFMIFRFAECKKNSIWGNEMSLREVDGAQSNATLNCRLRSCQHSCALHDRSFLFSFAFRRTTLDRPQGSSSLFLLLRAAFRVRASWILIWLVCRWVFRVFWALRNGNARLTLGWMTQNENEVEVVLRLGIECWSLTWLAK